jgi:hypothetical protein
VIGQPAVRSAVQRARARRAVRLAVITPTG